jgi:DNA-binding NarL/FixJ family response regulator
LIVGTDRVNTMRVLLVEDSPLIAERIRDLLETEAGAEVVLIADDEAGAIRAAREREVDVMILDLQLRGGTGFGVLVALGAARPATIIMTNYALPQYRAKAEAFGVEYFLDKSVDFDRLPAILATLDERRHS